jgi:hypothetical protein
MTPLEKHLSVTKWSLPATIYKQDLEPNSKSQILKEYTDLVSVLTNLLTDRWIALNILEYHTPKSGVVAWFDASFKPDTMVYVKNLQRYDNIISGFDDDGVLSNIIEYNHVFIFKTGQDYYVFHPSGKYHRMYNINFNNSTTDLISNYQFYNNSVFISSCEGNVYTINFCDTDPRYPNDSLFRISIRTYIRLKTKEYIFWWTVPDSPEIAATEIPEDDLRHPFENYKKGQSVKMFEFKFDANQKYELFPLKWVPLFHAGKPLYIFVKLQIVNAKKNYLKYDSKWFIFNRDTNIRTVNLFDLDLDLIFNQLEHYSMDFLGINEVYDVCAKDRDCIQSARSPTSSVAILHRTIDSCVNITILKLTETNELQRVKTITLDHEFHNTTDSTCMTFIEEDEIALLHRGKLHRIYV